MGTVRKRQSFLQGAFILAGGTALVKLIGAFFKIPLGIMIGGSGMGYFSTAYDLYLPLYALAMAGLPIAISRIVAQRVAEKRYRDVRKTLKIAQRAFLITGIAGTVIMLIAAYPYVLFSGNGPALYSILGIVPSLLFCCIMSSYRGYYEGLRNMYPTSVSSIIEALGKLVVGLGLAYIVIQKAMSEYAASQTVFGKALEIAPGSTDDVVKDSITAAAAPYAAAAAILGITIGAALGAVYLIIYHKRVGDKITVHELREAPQAIKNKKTLKIIITFAIPVVIGSLVTNVASLIDLATVQRRLADVVTSNPDTILKMYDGMLPEGMALQDIPNFLYGCYKGFGYSVYNLVPTLTSMLGISALPVLTTAWIGKDPKVIKTNIESMVRITALFAIPAGIGMWVLSANILGLLYSSRPQEAAVTVPILAILGLAAVFAGLMAPLTNMLQAIGKQKLPVRNIAIGGVLKIVVNFILVGIPSVNVVGAPVGTLVCYAFIFISNLYCLIKHSHVRISLMSTLIKPLIASLLCGVSAWAAPRLLTNIMPAQGNIVSILSILVAVIVYAVSVICVRAVTKEDVLSLPKGQKIARALEKLGWIR